MVVTFDDVHVILHLIPHGVGLLDAASARGIITCHGQPDHRAVGQDERFLYQTFAERAATYHQATVLVLDGSRDDFGGRGRIFIHQYDDSSFAEQSRALGAEFFIGSA